MHSTPALIDTHAHLYLPDFDADRGEIVDRARAAGVKKIYLPNIDLNTVGPMMEMVARYPGVCFPMIGLHPCSVKADYQEQMSALELLAEDPQVVAIGEIGTDLYWDTTFRKEQEECFRRQLLLAAKLGLPVAIHSRESLDWNIAIVRELSHTGIRGIFHCFTGTKEQALEIIQLGFLLGIGGVVTFKNAGLGEVIRNLPLESLVLETDAPYLTPHPHRGKRNASEYLALVAMKLAEVYGRSLEDVALITSASAERLFARGPANHKSGE